jgi:molybdopterin/thiamine biosynthesis adenylyltransferase
MKLFIVGSGAIGCELLKNLALMNASIYSENGKIIVADSDGIERSNLNRQLLFRQQHIGKPKALVASEMVRTINPDLNCTSIINKVTFNCTKIATFFF